MTSLSLRGIRKSYGTLDVLNDINLEIGHGEFVVFVGPSGCGKSTLLRMIAGLEDITSGELCIDGELANHLAPVKRGVAMVFQSYALYPHLSVYENMAFGMRRARMDKGEIDRRVQAAAATLQLTPYLGRLPKALSGGQRQRVAIGRSICRDPKIFLFDEPLSNLDAALRVATRIEIARMARRMADTTMIYVTHDQVEAMTLADRIVVLSAGRIEQVGRPLELYHRPANLFVARFIGSPAMNILPVRSVGTNGDIALPGGRELSLPIRPGSAAPGAILNLGLRPEDMAIATGSEWLIEGTVSAVEELGEVTMIYLDDILEGEPVVAKLPGTVAARIGDRLRLTAPAGRLHLFGDDGTNIGRMVGALEAEPA